MLKPTRTILALAAGSLVLGLVGAGAAVADTDPPADVPGQVAEDGELGSDDLAQPDGYPNRKHARGIVISRGPLTVRGKPSTHSYKVGRVHPHEKLAIECKTRGERVDGNNLWYLLDGKDDHDGMDPVSTTMDRKDRWVSARYVKNITEVKYCRS
ncbi:hypothetical protein SAVIM338S_06570 [Streptomyces avidinii]